ncbi:MAG: CPBP family intramembrane metalloprotease [Clostridia bacterium]|nr:CPBP family intramembrane metalloprotease [Clostridia bacterium]
MYRGVIYDKSKMYFSRFTAAIISSVMFGIMHLNMQQLPYAIVLGFVLAIIYEKSKSIIMPMIVHFIIDFSQM